MYLNENELNDTNGDELPFYYYETMTLGTCLNLGDKRFLPYNRITSVTNQLNNSHIRTTLALDNNGMVKSRVVENMNNKSNTLISKTTSQYIYNLITLPNGRQAAKIISLGETELLPKSTCTYQQTVNYSYENGRLKSETNSSTSITKAINSYNAFGFPISTSISAPNEVTVTEQKTYDNTGRFVISSTNAMNQVANATYDGKTGNILTATDINGLTTSYAYDVWGNNTLIIYPDDTRENTEISWFSNENFPNAIYCIKKTGTSLPTSIDYFDKLNRKTHSYIEGTGYVQNNYNEKGLLTKTSLPYLNSGDGEQTKIWHEYTYDIYDRVINEKAPYIDISTQYPTFQYASSQNIVKTTDNLRNITYSKTYDIPGRIISSTDLGGTITYTYSYYYKNGKTLLKQDVESNGSVTSIISDMQGNRLSITEPNSGIITTNYNKYNQVLSQTDANGNTTSYSYDILGRLTQKSINGNGESNVINYYYDNAHGKGKGQIHYTKMNGAGYEIFFYDDLGRLSSKNKFINGTVYKDKYTYNATGQIETFTYPDNFSLKYSYNKFGELFELKRGDNNDLIYRIDTRNKYRLQEQCVFGNNTGVKYRYNQFGLLTGISSGIISGSNTNKIDFESSGELAGNGYIVTNNYRQLNYSYDNKGFIIRKEDTRSGQYENYTYDKLDRLTSFTVGTIAPYISTTHTKAFNENGNISTNSQVGSYLYNSSRPHAVDNIRPNSVCTIPQTQNDVTYNNYNRVKTIYEDGKQLSFSYGADQQCNKSVYSVLNPSNGAFTTQKTKIYVSPLYEVETTSAGTQKIHYIYSDHGIVAIYVTDNTQNKMHYVHTDHLGSYNLIMDSDKNIVQSCHFDPWGNRRNYYNWNANITYNLPLCDRGFTGHEHLDAFKIINMRARLYDPVIGRFFSPDPYVQAPDNTQNFNRYSYCLNNPVMFTDPSGEFIQYIIGPVIGGFSGYMMSDNIGYKGWDKFWYTLGGAAIGAATAGIGTAVSSSAGVVAGGVVGGAAGGAGFGTMGGYAAGLRGGDLFYAGFNGMWQGAVTGLAGSFVGGAIGGGWGAFADGATTGGLGTLMSGGSGEDILQGAALGGVMGWGVYHASLAYSYHASGIKSTGLNYNQYAKMMATTQRSMFWNREGKFIPNSDGGFNVNALGDRNNTVSSNVPGDYENALFDYHTHQEYGYDRFSNIQDAIGAGVDSLRTDVTTRQVLTLYANRGRIDTMTMYLGTREGNMHYWTHYGVQGVLNYNFSHVFTPYILLWSMSLIR